MSKIRHAVRNPLRTVIKAVALAVALFLFARAAYAQGVRHAIENAIPSVDGEVIVIEYDGQLHEYR